MTGTTAQLESPFCWSEERSDTPLRISAPARTRVRFEMAARPPVSEEDQREVLECARYGELDDLRALLDAGADVNFRDAASGSTALHNAAANGHGDVVALLVDRGARCEPNANGNTPLHWAALNGHAAVVGVLLGRFEGMDALAKNAFGKSALTDAINAGHEDIARLILSHRSVDPSGGRPGVAGVGGAGAGGASVDEEDDGSGEDVGDEDADLLEAPGAPDAATVGGGAAGSGSS